MTTHVLESKGEEARPPRCDEPEEEGLGPYFVLVNPSSGSQDDRRVAEMRMFFRRSNVAGHVVQLTDASALPAVLRRTADLAEKTGGTLVVAGGDGTINAALPYVLERELKLAILPCGTFNYVAREFGIPLELEDALRTLEEGRVEHVPLALLNERPFLVNASLGLYPRLLEDRERATARHGRNRFFALGAAVASMWMRRDQRFVVEVQRAREGESGGAPHQLEISTLFIGNSTVQLERVGIELPEGSQALTAVALRTPSAARLLGLGWRAAFGSLGEAKDILSFPFERLIVKEAEEAGRLGLSRSGIKVAIDGEVMRLAGPLIFERAAERLRLVVPRTRSDDVL